MEVQCDMWVLYDGLGGWVRRRAGVHELTKMGTRWLCDVEVLYFRLYCSAMSSSMCMRDWAISYNGAMIFRRR